MKKTIVAAGAKAAFVIGALVMLPACSSTQMATSTHTTPNETPFAGAQSAVAANNQTYALANPFLSGNSFVEMQKAREEAQKKKLAADQKRQKAAAAALSDQQKQLMKAQRDALIKNRQQAQGELGKLTPKVAKGGGRYHSLIAQHASANGVPLKLAHAVVRVESAYRANARGSAGEIGLMQLKLSTARMMGYKGSAKGLYNPETNIRYGMKYLGKAHKLAGGSTCGTILKYNAGHGAKRMNPISRRYCNKVARYI